MFAWRRPCSLRLCIIKNPGAWKFQSTDSLSFSFVSLSLSCICIEWGLDEHMTHLCFGKVKSLKSFVNFGTQIHCSLFLQCWPFRKWTARGSEGSFIQPSSAVVWAALQKEVMRQVVIIASSESYCDTIMSPSFHHICCDQHLWYDQSLLYEQVLFYFEPIKWKTIVKVADLPDYHQSIQYINCFFSLCPCLIPGVSNLISEGAIKKIKMNLRAR